VRILWFDYPANTNALVSLVSFATSGIYLSFLLTVIGAAIARARGWVPEGKFRLGRWAWPVIVVAGLYLAAILVNIVVPSGLSSPRAFMNLDWITLVVMIIVAIVGVILFALARGGKAIDGHLRDDAEKPAAIR
jgi:amino acid transporter